MVDAWLAFFCLFLRLFAVYRDLWSLSEICGRSERFMVVHTDLWSFTQIYGRSTLIVQKKHGRKSLPCAKNV